MCMKMRERDNKKEIMGRIMECKERTGDILRLLSENLKLDNKLIA